MLLISLLGEQVIADESTGQVLTRSSRGVALVGYLVVHAGVPQPRGRVAAALWPDSRDPQALTNLRRELHHLRQALADEPALGVTSTHLLWQDTDTCRVDLRAFRRGVDRALSPAAADEEVVAQGLAALGEYRGDLLPGVYDEWAIEARERVTRDCVRLCDAVAEAARRQGDLRVAVDVSHRRIQVGPLEEVGYRRLMELQAELGDRAGAISTYHHCASVLERELAVEPNPATTRLLERLIGPREQPPVRSRPGPPRTARSGPAGSVLIARDVELARLAGQWRTARSGRAAAAVVHGGPGVGKTRLVTELAGLARRDAAVVATAQCFDTHGRLSLGPVADWLRTPAFRAATSRLPPMWRAEVERLVPPPAGRPVPGPDPVRPDVWQRNRFFEGLAHGLVAVDRPTFLVLDNVQWCDEDTLSFLTFLLHHAAGSPLMLTLTLRLDQHDGSDPVLRWLTRLRSVVPPTRLDLEPLDQQQTARLSESLTGHRPDDREARLLHAATGGFPLYVVEAARSAAPGTVLDGAPSAALSDVLRQRLAQTSADAQELAGLAAALGRDFGLPLLTEASDLDADAVAAAVDELWRHRIVHELGAGYDFSHDLLRETAYQQVSPPRRWLLHRRLAQALELDNAEHLDEVAAHLAEQYWKAGNRDRALTFYRRATEVATGLLAHAESIRLARTSLDLIAGLPPGRDRDTQELACLESIAPPLNALHGYSSTQVQQAFERTVVLARRLSHDDSWVAGTVGLWQTQFVQGHNRLAHDTARQLRDQVQPGARGFGQSRFCYAGSALSLGHIREALEHFDAACEVLGDEALTVGTRGWVHARAWSAHAAWLLGDRAGAAARADEAVVRARASGHTYTLTVALAYASLTQQLLGDRDRLGAAVAELRELCERHAFAYYADWALILAGWRRGGREGLPLVRRGLDSLQRLGAFARMPYWLTLLADLQVGQTSVATLDAALVAAASREDRWWEPELMRLRSRHDPPELARKRLAAALALATEQRSRTIRDRCAADLGDLPDGVRHPLSASTPDRPAGER